MKAYFVVAATIGLMASVSASEAAAPSNPPKPSPTTPPVNACDGAKGLMFGAYFDFLKQHPECAKPLIMPSNMSSAGGGNSDLGPAPTPSDRGLKHTIELVDVLENGLRLYAYKYLGDDRCFVGVMAQDLADDKHLAHAVRYGADGFMRVDYAALGLTVIGAEAMHEAGAKAIQLALAA